MFCDLLSDEEFLEAFEACRIPNDSFHHIDHVRMCYLYLRNDSFELASEKIINGIKKFAAFYEVKKLYHHTITWFWIYVIYDAIQKSDAGDFVAFLKKNPQLRNKEYVLEFYSKSLLFSDLARADWVNADKDLLSALPVSR